MYNGVAHNVAYICIADVYPPPMLQMLDAKQHPSIAAGAEDQIRKEENFCVSRGCGCGLITRTQKAI